MATAKDTNDSVLHCPIMLELIYMLWASFRCLKRRSVDARLLRLRVRIAPVS